MAARKTPFRRPTEPLPDYEIISPKERETVQSAECCVCGDPNSTWCNPENPGGVGSLINGVGAMLVAVNVGK